MNAKDFLSNFKDRASKHILKFGEADISTNYSEISSILNCEHCSAPVNFSNFNHEINTSICKYCGMPILKDFVFCFPEINFEGKPELSWCSVAANIESLEHHENER